MYIEKEEDVNTDTKGPCILKEFERALRELSDKKATGIDKIPAEIVKNLDEDTKNSLFKILNDSYEYGVIPADFTHSKTITLPKKGNSTVCSK